MVQHEAGTGLRHHFGQVWIKSQAAGIVDDLHAVFKSTFGGFPFVRIERNRDAQLIFQALQHWYQPAPFFLGGNAL